MSDEVEDGESKGRYLFDYGYPKPKKPQPPRPKTPCTGNYAKRKARQVFAREVGPFKGYPFHIYDDKPRRERTLISYILIRGVSQVTGPKYRGTKFSLPELWLWLDNEHAPLTELITSCSGFLGARWLGIQFSLWRGYPIEGWMYEPVEYFPGEADRYIWGVWSADEDVPEQLDTPFRRAHHV